jgi:hypothetical protein
MCDHGYDECMLAGAEATLFARGLGFLLLQLEKSGWQYATGECAFDDLTPGQKASCLNTTARGLFRADTPVVEPTFYRDAAVVAGYKEVCELTRLGLEHPDGRPYHRLLWRLEQAKEPFMTLHSKCQVK